MKYFAVVLIALIAVAYAADPIGLTEEQRQRVRAAAKVCLEQEGVPESTAQQLREGNFSSDDQKTKCFVNCFLEKLGMLADGKPQEAVIKQKLGAIVGEDKIINIMKNCNELKGADKCGTAFKLYECYYKNNAGLI